MSYHNTTTLDRLAQRLEVDPIFVCEGLYHAYMDIWDLLRREPDNHAAAVLEEDVIVGHVPYNLAPIIEKFLRQEANTGSGLEIPCIYILVIWTKIILQEAERTS
jgi:hypothetical protein